MADGGGLRVLCPPPNLMVPRGENIHIANERHGADADVLRLGHATITQECKMTTNSAEATARIQSAADRNNTNNDFKSRAQSSATTNAAKDRDTPQSSDKETPRPQK